MVDRDEKYPDADPKAPPKRPGDGGTTTQDEPAVPPVPGGPGLGGGGGTGGGGTGGGGTGGGGGGG